MPSTPESDAPHLRAFLDSFDIKSIRAKRIILGSKIVAPVLLVALFAWLIWSIKMPWYVFVPLLFAGILLRPFLQRPSAKALVQVVQKQPLGANYYLGQLGLSLRSPLDARMSPDSLQRLEAISEMYDQAVKDLPPPGSRTDRKSVV